MKNTFNFTALLIAMLLCNFTVAQAQGKIVFENITHDFGKIKEDGGVAIHKFVFKNQGNAPIVITNVSSSCGCTTPSWTRQPIAPGAEGFVSAAYDPRNRPSVFTKTVTVTAKLAEGKQVTVTLTIKGDVLAREKSLEEIYRYDLGGLRLKTNHAAFAQIYTHQTQTKELEAINNSDKEIVMSFPNLPAHLQARTIPAEIKPRQKAKIVFTYDAKVKNDYGYVTDYLLPKINGQSDNKYRLIVSASIREDFSKLSKNEIANGPTMDFENQTFDFGTIKQGQSVSHSFVFKNNGKTDLIIRKINASCGCTATSPESLVVKPGQTSKLDAVFNSAGKKGRQNKSITIITNIPDENNYRKILRMKGEVTAGLPYFNVTSRSASATDSDDAVRVYEIVCTKTNKKAKIVFRKDGEFELLESGIMWNDTFKTLKDAQEAALAQINCEK